jgi:hypothetical protein
VTYRAALKEFSVQYWTELLKKHDGNITQVALESGCNRTHLYLLLKKLGVVIERRQQPRANWDAPIPDYDTPLPVRPKGSRMAHAPRPRKLG